MGAIERNDQILAMLQERANLLDRRERELSAELKAVSDDLRRARAAIIALDPAHDALATSVNTDRVHAGRKLIPADAPPLTATAEEILRAAGTVMHIKEIIAALKARGLHPEWDDGRYRDTINGTIGRKARAKKVFFSDGPGRYGLIEWKRSDKKTTTARPVNQQPNTDRVVEYVAKHPGLTRAELIRAVEPEIKTAGDIRKIASTIVGALIKHDRLIEDASGIHVPPDAPQLSLVATA